MKFGDKLYVLRKKKGYSQEDLAEKLGVSRQSVSKWESNATYPETDKIVQIANIFDCSMDDLINDKVVDIETTFRTNKNNIKDVWNSLLEFITNMVYMFSKMNFSTGLKCIIEMVVLGLLLSLFGHIICSILSNIIVGIFGFLNNNYIEIFKNVLNGIFHLIWFVIASIVMIYTFKIRYLDDYQKPIDEVKSNNIKNNTDSDDYTNISVLSDKPMKFLSVLAQIVVFFIKIITFFILLGFVSLSIGLIIGIVIMTSLISVHLIFLWSSLLLLAFTIISIQIVILLINFIFNKRIKILYNVVVFVISIVLIGVSIGMITLCFKNFDYVRDNSLLKISKEEILLDYKDNLVIESSENSKYKYIIDNTMEDNKIIISKNIDKRYFQLNKYDSEMDKMPVIRITHNPKDSMKLITEFYMNNLKKNKIYTFESYGNDPLNIKANETTIYKLIDNSKKLYLIEEKKNDNEIDVVIHQSKVYFKYGLDGEYNALTDTIIYHDDHYSCKKETEITSYGERFIYTCDNTMEDD